MKLLLFVVNYRSDEPLRHCLGSLPKAASVGAEPLQLQVHVHDNSEYDTVARQRLRTMLGALPDVAVQLHVAERNNGYFGGLPLAQQLAAQQGSDVVIYSNADLRFAPDFFTQLALLRSQSPGLLAPAIVSQQDGFDQNPKYLARLTRAKLLRLQRIYASAPGFTLYMGLARLKEIVLGKRARAVVPTAAATPIYAAHGAAFVFSDPGFFQALPAYPCFLFGEELFVAEEASQRGVPTTYRPELRIDDLRSQSISQLPGDFHRRLMLKSVEFILGRYYQASA